MLPSIANDDAERHRDQKFARHANMTRQLELDGDDEYQIPRSRHAVKDSVDGVVDRAPKDGQDSIERS